MGAQSHLEQQGRCYLGVRKARATEQWYVSWKKSEFGESDLSPFSAFSHISASFLRLELKIPPLKLPWPRLPTWEETHEIT